MGAIGFNSGAYNDIAMLKNLLNVNVRAIPGYPGRSEVHLSIERGELDGECGSKEGIPESWIRDKKMNIVVRMLQAKSDDIPEGVPWVGDFLKDPQDFEVLRLLDGSNGHRKAICRLGRGSRRTARALAERLRGCGAGQGVS